MTEFLPLIIEHEGEALTTSRAVAENFGKQHSHIIRAIEQIFEDGNTLKNGASQSNFGLAEIEGNGRKIAPANLENSQPNFRLVNPENEPESNPLNFAPVDRNQSGGTAAEFLAANFRLSEYTDANNRPPKSSKGE